ncbi:hypothetical protein BDV12DRAFT_190286 [Aspergillus spectabilis]
MSSYLSTLGSEDDASIYSHSPDSPKLRVPSQTQTIALARGPTIALDTTRTRLQAVKRRSVPETLKDKRQQWAQQERENQFYEHRLRIFQPENPRIWGAAQKLRDTLRQSQEREAVAEHEWKKQWNMPRMGTPSSRWV